MPTAASRDHAVESITGPGRTSNVDEGAALGRGFELALARRHEGGSELGNLTQHGAILCGCGAMRLRQKHGVAEAGAITEHRAEPVAQ